MWGRRERRCAGLRHPRALLPPTQGPVGIAISDETAGVPEAFLAAAAAADVKTVDATRGFELFLGCKDLEAVAQVR